jgi:hypothetical protein
MNNVQTTKKTNEEIEFEFMKLHDYLYESSDGKRRDFHFVYSQDRSQSTLVDSFHEHLSAYQALKELGEWHFNKERWPEIENIWHRYLLKKGDKSINGMVEIYELYQLLHEKLKTPNWNAIVVDDDSGKRITLPCEYWTQPDSRYSLLCGKYSGYPRHKDHPGLLKGNVFFKKEDIDRIIGKRSAAASGTETPTDNIYSRLLEKGYYISPFITLMLKAIEENKITEEEQLEAKQLQPWFRKQQVGFHLSDQEIDKLTTFVRSPDKRRKSSKMTSKK